MPEKSHKSLLKSIYILPTTLGLFLFFAVSVTFAADISPSEVVKLVNRSRAEQGLSPLVHNAKLAAAAEAKARDMIKHDYFAHTSPQGASPWAWVKESGYNYKYAGENLAINFTNAKEEHSAWMKSKTHRDNILNAKYTEVGVAVVTGKIDGETSIVTVQIFGTPMVAVADAVTPATIPTVPEAVPAVQGVEISMPVDLPLPPTPPDFVPPIALNPVTTIPLDSVPQWIDMATLSMVALLWFLIVLSPALFLWRSYRDMFSIRKRSAASEGTIRIPVHAVAS